MHIEIREVRQRFEAVAAERTELAEKLAGLGQIDLATGAIMPPDPAGDLVGYTIKVNGVDLPVTATAYEVVATDDGPAVTFTIPATQVSVGPAMPAPNTPKGKTMRTWGGDAETRDPREAIPGWTPEAGADRG